MHKSRTWCFKDCGYDGGDCCIGDHQYCTICECHQIGTTHSSTMLTNGSTMHRISFSQILSNDDERDHQ